MICGYQDCGEEITDGQFIYQYFSEEKIHKPVHSFHLMINRKERSSEIPTPIDPGNRPEELSEQNISDA